MSAIVNPTWAGPCLLVPMYSEALLIGTPNQDASRFTWANTGYDYTALPFATPAAPPFSTNGGTPATGLHLSWTLPSALRSGQQPGAQGAVQFPTTPNRWLVTRSYVAADGSAPVLTAWVVQSDYTGPDGTVSWPAPGSDLGYTRLGKVYTLASWRAQPGAQPPFLQAVAPGNVAFASVYANVGNVFAFYDPLPDSAQGSYAYSVLGWYATPANDPLFGANGGFTNQAQWQALMDGLDWSTLTTVAEAQAAWQAWLLANPISGGPALTPAQGQLASQTLCHSLLYGIEWKGNGYPYPLYTDPTISPNPPAVSIGSNSAEALAAWIASTMPGPVQQEVETMLLAFQNGLIFDYATDTAKFEMVTQAARFGSLPGGLAWVVARPGDANLSLAAQGGNSTLPLDADQTAALTELAALQQQLDDGRALLLSLQQALYAALWKQINWTNRSGIPKSQVLNYVKLLSDPTTGLIPSTQRQIDQLSGQVDAKAAALRALLGKTYELSSLPAARSYGPMDPVVLVAGAGTDSKLAQPGAFGDANGAAGRFTGQTIRALTLAVPPGSATMVTLDAADFAGRFPTGSGIPKESADFWTETILLDPGNALWLAKLAYAKTSLPPPSDQALAALAAVIRAQQALPFSSEGLALADPALLAAAVGFSGVAPSAIAVDPWVTPWTPVYLDWQVGWSPSAPGPDLPGMLKDWTLEDVDYVWNGGAIPAVTDVYTGRTTLTPNQALGLNASIEQFLAVPANVQNLLQFDVLALQQAAKALSNLDVLAQSLGGLNAQFGMRLDQPTSIAGTAQAPLTGGVSGYIPAVTGKTFYPLRSGHFTIQKLWVVDAYGQVLKAVDTNVNVRPIVSQAMRTDGVPGTAQMPPRITQSSRLSTWLVDAQDDGVPSNSSDETSPLCGWLLPNHLDSSLTVFDAAGNNLGALIQIQNDQGQAVRWDAVPGGGAALGAPPAIANPHLAGLVAGILGQGANQVGALSALLDAIDVTLWKTDPLGQPNTGNLSVLVGRPLAVVRLAGSLGTAGQPWVRQDWAATGLNQDGGLPQAQLQVRLGDHGLDQNGVAGYYLGDAYGTFYAARGYTPSLGNLRRTLASRAGGTAERLAHAVRGLPQLGAEAAGNPYVVTDATFPLPADGTTTQYLTALVDPRGQIPLVSGIQPVEYLALPAGPVSAALTTMFVTFRMGPLLTDPVELTMPLPGAVGGNWSWIERSGVSVWREDANIVQPGGGATLADTPPTLREGWLKLGGAFGGK
ncbi:hypothetical protein [Chitinimonas koreensis]|uniref:hypothetical protein n=1 Tax=Chitinimonas koreensis TaxID=356302 RepID=UPI000413670A|nr:hypothetical protein [Chitinimonas koreensis]QNM98723.1 hypothetical protein H9L41_11180 [Chitinimonas koreensis]